MLYEPTNIIPSLQSSTGTVAATTDNVDIQWQANGNSAMTMFQIDVMQNNVNSDLVFSTGIISQNPQPPTGADVTYTALPFYGKDRYGDYVSFVYYPNLAWAAWSNNAISDGNTYKLSITQFFKDNSTSVKISLLSALTQNGAYYFSYSQGGALQYVVFTVGNASLFASGNTIYYNTTHNVGWIRESENNQRIAANVTFSYSEEEPTAGTSLGSANALTSEDVFYNRYFTSQYAPAAFLTRTKPTLVIATITSPVTSATQSFSATYSQAQGDNIRSVRWQLFNADDLSEPIDDTGIIYTPVLEYEYNSLFNGEFYLVQCTVETENGKSVTEQESFSVQYTEGVYSGDFTAEMLCDEDANLLQWDSALNIPGVDNPEGSAQIAGGKLILPENATLTWSQQSNDEGQLQPLNLKAPWTVAWNGDIDQPSISLIRGTIKKSFTTISYGSQLSGTNAGACAFSPDGKILVVCSVGDWYVYSVNGETITFVSEITKSGATIGAIKTVVFSPDGSLLLIGGRFSGHACVYSVSADNNSINVQYQYDLQRNGAALDDDVNTASFSPDGKILVLGGYFEGKACVYSVNGTSVVYVSDIERSGINPSFNNRDYVNTAAFSPDGSLLVLGGDFSVGSATLFSVNGTTITRKYELSLDTGTLDIVTAVTFSPDGVKLLAADTNGGANGELYVFTVEDSEVVFLKTLLKGGSIFGKQIKGLNFSPSGSALIVSGYFNGYASQFEVSGTNFTYIEDLENATLSQGCAYNPLGNLLVTSSAPVRCYYVGQGEEDNKFSDTVYTFATNHNETLAVFGGSFKEKASVFSIDDGILNKISDITKKGISLDGNVNAAAFSPNGSLLVIGGLFDGNASVFSVSGETIEYIKDLTLAGGAPIDNEVSSISFSPDGSILVLGGAFTGYAAEFSVSGVSVTYNSVITKGSNPLTGNVNCIAFAPDGDLLVLGGSFAGYASAFGVNGAILTFKTDILISENGLESPVKALAFSPSGNLLAVGGNQIQLFEILQSTSANPFSYKNEITKNGATNFTFESFVFSPDEKYFVVGGTFFDGSPLFSVNGTDVTYLTQVLANGNIYTVGFINNDTFLLAGGSSFEFAGLTNIYSISGETISGNLFNIQPDNIVVSRNGQVIMAMEGNNVLGKTYIAGAPQGGSNQIIIAITPTNMAVYSFRNGTYIIAQETALTYSQQNISSAQLTGEQTCNYFLIIDGNGNDILPSLQNPSFIPQWSNGGQYNVDLFADFNGTTQGGISTDSGAGYRIYRRSLTGGEYKEIATLPSTITTIKDYGIKSGETYTYDFYAYDANGAFMGVRTTEATPIVKKFKRFSLLSTQYNDEDGCYHVVKEYQFSCNIQDMAISNNNNPSFVQNFTRYPTRMKSSANYASGTLQALIGFVDMKSYKYWDSTALMDELNSLSTTDNTLFLRDMKGHLWMVATSSAIQQTSTQKTREMQVTISLPWTEIGDASAVSIIQTPNDAGWDYDAQVLDVRFDINIETGMLEVTYPEPYKGTTFSLVENSLVASTPDGTTSPTFTISPSLMEPEDGQITATSKEPD